MWLPSAFLHMRLEDLTRDPAEYTRRLFEFCGVDPESPLDFSSDARHIAGNYMRHGFDGTIRNDESWRHKLTKDELDYFRQRAGKVNQSLGYGD